MTTSDTSVTRVTTRKGTIRESRIETSSTPDCGVDEVLLALCRFALTSNNITYATFGDQLDYWKYFPLEDAAWGQIPVWGFADVVASSVSGVEAGERFFGFFPLASHVRMRPERVTARGFHDGAPHRRALNNAYNQYTRCRADPLYASERESLQALVRPLFLTSFLVADYLADNRFFGAARIAVSSASSKTAFGAAHCLAWHSDLELLAVTSARSRSFVDGLGCYDHVVTYGELANVGNSDATVYLDFSGNEALRAEVHSHFGAALVYDCFVGSTHNANFLPDGELPGPETCFFFGPAQLRKRNAEWGRAEFARRFNAAEQNFMRLLSVPGNPWIEIHESAGFPAAQRLLAELHEGTVEPKRGNVVLLDGVAG